MFVCTQMYIQRIDVPQLALLRSTPIVFKFYSHLFGEGRVLGLVPTWKSEHVEVRGRFPGVSFLTVWVPGMKLGTFGLVAIRFSL